MDRRFRHRRKNVHDIKVANGIVRLWSVDGLRSRRMIEKAFQPLLRSALVHPYVALMPDYHPGEGAMIGSVIPTGEVLLPTVIGGDLGCGMIAVQLPVRAEAIGPKLEEIRQEIKQRIPVGTAHNAEVGPRVEANPIWERQVKAPYLASRLRRKMLRQFGSLGSGNHFIEIQKDGAGDVWVMLHSGSRYLGVAVRDYYVGAGTEQAGIDRKLYSRVAHLEAGTELAADYLADLSFAVDFARESRKEMMLRILEVLSSYSTGVDQAGGTKLISHAHDMVHNYIAEEVHFQERLFVHRKGAIRVGEGETGLVPGSMGTRSYVVEGRGSEFSFCSCAHGAGRKMSRADAFRKISDRDFTSSMRDVIYEHNDRLRDEAPPAYKDISLVMRAQRDIVRIVSELRPMASIKGW